MAVSGFTEHEMLQHTKMQTTRMNSRFKTKNGGTDSEGRTDDALVNQEQQRKSVHLRHSTATSRNGLSAPQLALQYCEAWGLRSMLVYRVQIGVWFSYGEVDLSKMW